MFKTQVDLPPSQFYFLPWADEVVADLRAGECRKLAERSLMRSIHDLKGAELPNRRRFFAPDFS